jgi:hypothetical protein
LGDLIQGKSHCDTLGPSSLGKFSRLIHPRAVAQTLEKWGVVAGYAHRQPGLIMCKNVQVEEASLRR